MRVRIFMLMASIVARGKCAAQGQRKYSFLGGRIAVLLTGQAFREPKYHNSLDHARYCVNASFEAQHVASQSILSHVIKPLEANGAAVEVLFTLPPCNTMELDDLFVQTLKSWYKNRVVAHRIVRSRNVGHSWQLAFMLLKSHMELAGVSYEFVFSVRHDLEFLHNILHSPANFSQILFSGGAYSNQGVQVNCIDWETNCRVIADDKAPGGERIGDCSEWKTVCYPKVDDKMLWVPHVLLPFVLDKLGIEHEEEEEDSMFHSLFNPHHFVQHFITVNPQVLVKAYDNHLLHALTCAASSDLVQQQLQVDLNGVGFLGICGVQLFRFAPDRGWNRALRH